MRSLFAVEGDVIGLELLEMDDSTLRYLCILQSQSREYNLSLSSVDAPCISMFCAKSLYIQPFPTLQPRIGICAYMQPFLLPSQLAHSSANFKASLINTRAVLIPLCRSAPSFHKGTARGTSTASDNPPESTGSSFNHL